MLNRHFSSMPLIAILRGVTPPEAAAVGQILYDAGFRCIEVPLNSPDPLASIAQLRAALPRECIVGAGTVLRTSQVADVKAAGGELIVMPHGAPDVIRAAKAAGLLCAPGAVTPTEGFAALANGADALKLFPAEQLPPQVVKAWRSVFPASVKLIPVGGIQPRGMAAYLEAGADGFGIGSALYAPGISLDALRERANAFIAAVPVSGV